MPKNNSKKRKAWRKERVEMGTADKPTPEERLLYAIFGKYPRVGRPGTSHDSN